MYVCSNVPIYGERVRRRASTRWKPQIKMQEITESVSIACEMSAATENVSNVSIEFPGYGCYDAK